MNTKFQWRHQYDEERDEIEAEMTKATAHEKEPSKTQQQFAEDADINVLMRRFGITDGAIPPGVADPRFYGDFTNVPDFRDALDRTRDAVNRFNALPAALRGRFHNDPAELWAFVNNPENDDESVRLGLLKRVAAPEEAPAPKTPTPQE